MIFPASSKAGQLVPDDDPPWVRVNACIAQSNCLCQISSSVAGAPASSALLRASSSRCTEACSPVSTGDPPTGTWFAPVAALRCCDAASRLRSRAGVAPKGPEPPSVLLLRTRCSADRVEAFSSSSEVAPLTPATWPVSSWTWPGSTPGLCR
jgi:hypothetical protein